MPPVPVRSLRSLAVFFALAVGLLVPAGAHAASFEVTSTGDTANASANGTCAAPGGGCTLREAIVEANAGSSADTITFNATTFNGTAPGSVINAGMTMPPITEEVSIQTSGCTTLLTPDPSPCAEVRVSQPLQVFNVNGDDVTIQGLALNGPSATGVEIVGTSQRTTITGSWFGRGLDGNHSGVHTGIRLQENAGNAQIGGDTAADRNVFEAGTNGIEILGDDNTIEGNTFGFKPDGTPGFGSIYAVHIGVAVNGLPPASGNVVGGDDPGGLTPTVCDGPCNMFANAGTQILLQNSSVNEVDQTTIKGNFLGFDRDGTPVNGANGFAIDSQESDDTTVGGTTQASANYIGGAGLGGVQTTPGGSAISIDHNFFGLGPDGDTLHPNGQSDLDLRAIGTTVVEDNRFTSDGVEPTFAAIDIDGGGVAVKGNVIGLGTGNEDFGYNVPAIRVGGVNNIIGGDTAADYNTISHGADTAIEVSDNAGSTEVATNLFDDNDGMFIDLIPSRGPGNDPATGANDGIQAPVVSAASTTTAQGTREDASPLPVTVRVYSVTPGGIATFLAEDTGTGSTWNASFSAVPADTCLAATQTISFGGSSELSQPIPADTGTCDFTAPGTQIDDGPAQGSTTFDTTPTFEFSSASGTAFQCRFDTEAWRACSTTADDTPAAPLAAGSHTFQVRAEDAAGNVDPTPASRDFTVDTPHTTGTTVVCAPSSVTLGDDTTCTATVTDQSGSPTKPTGQVQLATSDAGAFTPAASCTLGGPGASSSSCQVTYTPSAIGSGTHAVTATYGATATHQASSDDFDVTVGTEHTTTTTLLCSPASVVVATTTTCTATVTDVTGTPTRPAGQVQLVTNSNGTFTPLASCTLGGSGSSQASCQVTYRPTTRGSGTHQLTASYAGSAEHFASSDAANVTVRTAAGPGTDTTPPDTEITTHPKKKLKIKAGKKKAKATFEFTSTETGSSFECFVDSKPPTACTSPKVVKLKKGKHTFSVAATDAVGNTDATPATFKVKVKRKRA